MAVERVPMTPNYWLLPCWSVSDAEYEQLIFWLRFNFIRAAPNSRLIVSRPEEAWSTKIVLVAGKNHIGEVTQIVNGWSMVMQDIQTLTYLLKYASISNITWPLNLMLLMMLFKCLCGCWTVAYTEGQMEAPVHSLALKILNFWSYR